MNRHPSASGFTVFELLIALSIGAMLITGLLQVVQAAVHGYRSQQNLSAMQDTARYALETLGHEITAAGFNPEPWRPELHLQIPAAATADGISALSDRIAIRRWSNRNCYGTPNPQLDADGQAAWYLLENQFEIDDSGRLAQTCRYGPDAGQFTTQINHYALVEGVEALQAVYAEDRDGDDDADHWVTAGAWQSPERVRAVRLAIAVVSPYPARAPDMAPLRMLDTTYPPPADGHLHQVFTTTVAIRSRRP